MDTGHPPTEARTRAFVAVHPDAPTLAAIADLLAMLQAREREAIRWIRPEQAHFTLRFFGDCDAAEVEAAARVLSAVAAAAAGFRLSLDGLGAFPDWRRPRIVWLGSGEGGGTLEQLARTLDAAFRDVGLDRSDRPFRAHLTLGRVREGCTLSPATLALLEGMRPVLPAFQVESVQLVASRLTPSGAIHRAIASARLEG
ncbi:MAG TPA: RNA 2',3'-cyclic phosphodiesterase [Candidatus Eisenbacteria bacterium]